MNMIQVDNERCLLWCQDDVDSYIDFLESQDDSPYIDEEGCIEMTEEEVFEVFFRMNQDEHLSSIIFESLRNQIESVLNERTKEKV